MNLVEFLQDLSQKGVKFWIEGGQLRSGGSQKVLTSDVITQLKQYKVEILQLLRDRPDILNVYPLSLAQERLWFLNQLEGASASYNLSGAVRITGQLELNALQQALSEIVRRHEVLRTSFQTVNGTPIQLIHPEVTMNINLVDLQQHSEQERETLLIQLAQKEATTPFDLERAPLIKCSLLQLDAREYVLLLTMHHIVSDGWSMGVLIQEVSSLYQAFGAGEPSPLAELPIQYADFAVWQRKWLSGEVLETQLNYWKQQLHGAPSLLQLPTDRPRATMQTYQGATQTFTLLNTELTQKLQTLSRESGSTLFMTLQAAFATLLYRYSGQSDILIGSPIAGRNRAEIEGLIGFFLNTLVVRTDISGNPSFLELLRRVRSVTLDAYAHQDVPFEKLVEELQPERSLSYNPLFQVFFNMTWSEKETHLELPGVKIEPFDMGEATTSKFDLTLYVAEEKHGIQLKLVYNADLFTSERMVEMLNQFHHLLTQIVAAPDNPISFYSLVTPKSKPLLPDPSAVLPEPEYELVTTI